MRRVRSVGGLSGLLAALVMGAWLPFLGNAQAADGDPPTLRIRVVNDIDALALAPEREEDPVGDAAPRIDARHGQQCVWMSNLLWEHLGALQANMAQANPGTGGRAPDARPRHGDVCVLAKLTSYRSSSLIGRPIELMSHWTRPTEGSPDDSASQYLAGNTHLVQYEEGGAIADSERSPERVKSFVEMAWREPMPAAH